MSRQRIIFAITVIIFSLQLLAGPSEQEVPNHIVGLGDPSLFLTKKMSEEARLSRMKSICDGLLKYLQAVIRSNQGQGLEVVSLVNRDYSILELFSVFGESGIPFPYSEAEVRALIIDNQRVLNEKIINKRDSFFAPLQPAEPIANLPDLLELGVCKIESEQEGAAWASNLEIPNVARQAIITPHAFQPKALHDPIEEWSDEPVKTRALPPTIFEKYLKPLKTIYRVRIAGGRVVYLQHGYPPLEVVQVS